LARLDRAFTNLDHCQTFPSTSLHSLPRPTSDHTPIMLNMDTTIPRPSTFRFKKMCGCTTTPFSLPSSRPGNMLRCVWMQLGRLRSASRQRERLLRFGLGV
jgi:hypothetical protein